MPLFVEALKHPVKRKICEDPKLDIYIKEAQRASVVSMPPSNLVRAAPDLPGGERGSREKILEQQACNAWLALPVKTMALRCARGRCLFEELSST